MKLSTSLLGLIVLSIVSSVAFMVSACGDDDRSTSGIQGSETITATPVATQAATGTPTLEEEITSAYLRYWSAYEQALLNLDPTVMEPLTADAELQRIREEVAILRSQGVALRVVVSHKPVVVDATGTSASVIDEMVNNSFYVDPVTKNPPVASGSGETLRDSFRLEKRNGQWLVISSTRQRQVQ